MKRARLMVCSNSLMVEPDEQRQPIVRYYFRAMGAPPGELAIEPRGAPRLKAGAAGRTIAFRCWRRAEMKAGGVIGPYTIVGGKRAEPPESLALTCISFVHTPPADVLPLITQLWHIQQKAMEGSARVGHELLKYVAFG